MTTTSSPRDAHERDRLTVPQGLAALSLDALASVAYGGDEVRAVTVVHPDDEDESGADRMREAWSAWHPQVPLTVLSSRARSLTRPIVDYLHAIGAEEAAAPSAEAHERLVVLIPELHLPHVWQRLLQNQRGAVLDRAIRRYTDVVICRLRFRIEMPDRPPGEPVPEPGRGGGRGPR